MAVTNMDSMINPQVMGDMIDAKIQAMAKLTPYAKVDTTLVGVPGDTKTVPSWNYIGDAEDVAEGDEVDLTALTAASVTFTIKKAMKAVGLTQEAVNSGLGNPIGQAETQLAKSIIGKVDNDVLDAAYTSANVYNGTSAVIGYDAIVDAVTKFEDEEDGIEKVMFIHPKQEATLLKDADFLSADKFQGGVAVNGAIGKIAGCWIKKSAKVKSVDAVTAVPGVYTLTITGTATIGDTITVGGVTYTAEAADNEIAVATALETAIKANTTLNGLFTVGRNAGVITLTQKPAGTGAMPVVVNKSGATATGAIVTTIAGVAAVPKHYACPIIKLEPDNAETEYTEDELPAITIFLKKDTSVDTEWMPKKQQTDITACKYYGVALTNAAKVVVAKFGE
jgi:N4-gp56 family major capsid protein